VTFGRWLHLTDLVPLLVALAAVAANLFLEGDPVWLLLVGASGGGKTEILRAMSGLKRVLQAATLTEAALLSGSPKRDHTADAKGGLLRQVGDRGVIIFKDFTSILSLHKDARAQVLAALREIYDGSWTRHVGTDGGRTLTWSGHLGIVAGCTPTIDRHHGVIAALGERFVMLRLRTADRRELARRALAHKGQERAMRAELAEAVAGLFAGLDTRPRQITEAERELLVGVADFTARARSAVEREGTSREIELIPEPEAPTRIAGSLARLRDGLLAIGVPRDVAINIACRVAMDSIPALRRAALNTLAGGVGPRNTSDLAVAMRHPTVTVRRTLEDLEGHGLVRRLAQGQGKADNWMLDHEVRLEMATLPEKSSYTEKEILEAVAYSPSSTHPDLSEMVSTEATNPSSKLPPAESPHDHGYVPKVECAPSSTSGVTGSASPAKGHKDCGDA
jgi:hypothetical protein